MKERIKEKIHGVLGWGYPIGQQEDDDFQPTFACKFCDYRLAQDSTGAYFHLSEKQDSPRGITESKEFRSSEGNDARK